MTRSYECITKSITAAKYECLLWMFADAGRCFNAGNGSKVPETLHFIIVTSASRH